MRLGSLGDVVHAIPAVAALRGRYPSARIDWMIDPRYAELLELIEGLDDVIPVRPRAIGPGAAGLLSAVRRARRVGYDAVIDLQGLLKSAVLARAAGGARTIGFPKACLREPLARFFYSDTHDPGPDDRHVVSMNLAVLGAAGVVEREARFPLRVPRTTVALAVAERSGADGYALVNPGAAWPNKRWPASRFGAVSSAIRRDLGLRFLVLWGPGEEGLASDVVSASAGAAELAPATTIQDVVGLAAGARLMVSGDTGPLHLAAAVGTPIVALLGPTLPERNGPWSTRDVTVSRAHECVCLYQRRCHRSSWCMDAISVEEVATAARRRMGVGE